MLGVGGSSWPPHQLLKRISIHIAGEVVVSDHPGAVLRKWREIFGASQMEIARHMGVTSSVVSDYEKGRRSPGSNYIRRFVDALLEVDATRGWPTVGKLVRMLNLSYLGAVIDMEEFERGVGLDSLITAVKGVPLNTMLYVERIYGYTVIDSLKAIISLSGSDFLNLLGATSQRAMVFTGVTTGRSPMIALRVSTIRPAVIVIHGPKRMDTLALWIAETERVPIILSVAKNVEDLVAGLRKLTSVPR